MDAEDILSEKIGEGLIRLGEMNQKQVDYVLQQQKNGDSRLFGEIAVDLGYIDLMSVIRYLEQEEE